MNPPEPVPGAPRRRRKVVKLLIAALVSTIISLALCEAGLRLFTNRRPGQGSTGGDPWWVERFLGRLPELSGTDRKWFFEDPPPVPRTPVSEDRRKRYQDYERRGLFGPQSEYVWNRAYLETQRCSAATAFAGFPDRIRVFDPPLTTIFPRYRFPTGITTVDGLVTNQFGLRGPALALAKPAKTVRIAFLGASTTVGFHGFAFSYGERVVHWLNRFAEANHYDVRFDRPGPPGRAASAESRPGGVLRGVESVYREQPHDHAEHSPAQEDRPANHGADPQGTGVPAHQPGARRAGGSRIQPIP
jgi:hypothetical protein